MFIRIIHLTIAATVDADGGVAIEDGSGLENGSIVNMQALTRSSDMKPPGPLIYNQDAA